MDVEERQGTFLNIEKIEMEGNPFDLDFRVGFLKYFHIHFDFQIYSKVNNTWCSVSNISFFRVMKTYKYQRSDCFEIK